MVTEPCYVQTAIGLNKSTPEDELLRTAHIHRSAVKIGTLRSTGMCTSQFHIRCSERKRGQKHPEAISFSTLKDKHKWGIQYLTEDNMHNERANMVVISIKGISDTNIIS